MPDVAIFSPAVPPARSGQAVILHRLLAGVPADRYLLIDDATYRKHQDAVATAKLGAAEAHVYPVTAKALPDARRRALAAAPYYEAREVRGRARQFEAILRAHGVTTLVACTGDHYDFPAAYFAARKAGVRFVAYLFDDYLYQCPGYLRPIAFAWERIVLRGAHRVVVTNERFAELVRARHGVEATVVHNAVEPLDLSAPLGPNPFPGEERAVVFAGTIYNAHYDAFRNLVKALERYPHARLHLFSFQNPADLAAQGIGGPQVVVEGFRPQAEVLDAQRHADVLFLPLAFESPLKKLLRTAAPGKTAEYLSLGRPVLVHAPADTFLASYFQKHECGLVVDTNDPNAVAAALGRLFTDANLRDRLVENARRRANDDFAVATARATFLPIAGLA